MKKGLRTWVPKTPSPKTTEEEASSEMEKGSAPSIPSSILDADLPAPVPDSLEDPTVSVAEDPQDPHVPSVLTADGNVHDSVI
ncbi:hypothetical protein Bca52824_038494 [Brassica carinata]|uniref:Uncharacterized protein n=1 Tax=Brassica carinata TaxID=52824 RepID=A0A8X7UTR8_BRACI|nr:hypothetical protein Bca52824_038494 [Brassica carinata]